MRDKNKVFMGIDVSKDTLDISCGDTWVKIGNDLKSINAFIKKGLATGWPNLCVIESTGGYEKRVRKAFQAVGVPVHTAHPNRVHAFAKACNHFAKTDKLDAVLLQKYAKFVEPKARIDSIPTASQEALEGLRLVQRALKEELHSHQCRGHHLSGEAKKYMNAHIRSTKSKLKKLHESIESIIDADEELRDRKRLLKSFKGVGDTVANVLLCECPELGSLTKQGVASLVGLAPKTQESGRKKFKSKIQGGRFFVRKALYMSALVAIRYNPKLRAFYERLVSHGKCFKVAIVAVMRKIIVTLNAMLKKGECYAC